MKVTALRCEYEENPLGIHHPRPRLSWRLESSERGGRQAAYRVQVASSLARLREGTFDLWDSGRVESDRSVHVEYAGQELQSAQRAYWKVTVWSSNGEQAESGTAFWEMGLLTEDDRAGRWIGMGSRYREGWAPLLRKEFQLPAGVESARAYICGLGHYELYLNGRKVGDHVLDPHQSDYEERAFYVVYDVADYLESDGNAVGVILGDGWYHQSRLWDDQGIFEGNGIYGPPKLWMQLQIELKSGQRITLATDETWKTQYSPITLNNPYGGENYDARLEEPGWSAPGFDDGHWYPAAPAEPPGKRLEPQLMRPIRRQQEIRPVAIREVRNGVFVADFGVNLAGWARLKVKGHPGMEIVLTFAETLDGEGMIDVSSCAGQYLRMVQNDKYITRSHDWETWEPRFAYHGFRYVQVVGYPEALTPEGITAIKLHTDLDEAGDFNCSSPRLNELHELAKNTMTSNLFSVSTDCPVREKCGWTGDVLVISDTLTYNWNTATFWTKYVQDIESSRRVYGTWMNVVPGRRNCLEASAAWGSAQVEVPWLLYTFYEDRRILQDHYAAMKAWVDHLAASAGQPEIQKKLAFSCYGQHPFPAEDPDPHILYYGLDDWAQPNFLEVFGKTIPQVSTAYFYMSARTTARAASVLDNQEDAQALNELSLRIKEAFIRRFYDPVNHTYGTQTVDSLAVYLDLVPEGDAAKVAGTIAEDLRCRDYLLTVGNIGCRYIFEALTDHGYGEVVRKVLEADACPSYGYMLKHGATTIWELWEGDAGSYNHPFKGSYDLWYFTHVLGIRPEEPGFRRISIYPKALDIMDHAKGRYDCLYGTIAVEWEKKDGMLSLRVDIPANTEATVRLPAADLERVRESDQPICNRNAIKNAYLEDGCAVLSIVSGKYVFESCL